MAVRLQSLGARRRSARVTVLGGVRVKYRYERYSLVCVLSKCCSHGNIKNLSKCHTVQKYARIHTHKNMFKFIHTNLFLKDVAVGLERVHAASSSHGEAEGASRGSRDLKRPCRDDRADNVQRESSWKNNNNNF